MKSKHKELKYLTRQELYIKKHKEYHSKIAILRFTLFASIILIWELASFFQLIDPFFFSSPSLIIKCILQMIDMQSLLAHISITLLETILSFILVMVLSLLFSTILWYYNALSQVSEPLLVVLNSLPKSALAPLFIVWLGTGMKTIIVAGVSVALFGTIISLYTGFHSVDQDSITLIYTLNGTKKDAFLKVVFPSCIKTILSTMKVNIGLALVGVIIGEFLAARKGLGYLIIYGSQVFKMDMVISCIILLCFIAMGFYQSIQYLEHLYKRKY